MVFSIHCDDASSTRSVSEKKEKLFVDISTSKCFQELVHEQGLPQRTGLDLGNFPALAYHFRLVLPAKYSLPLEVLNDLLPWISDAFIVTCTAYVVMSFTLFVIVQYLLL